MHNPDHTASEKQSLLKILLAEDNRTNQKLTLRQLQTLGYSAALVENGQAAVDAVKQAHYDIVLMDCQMPLLDGFDAAQAIRDWERQQSQHRPVVIIAMTASDLEQDRTRAKTIGMNDYLTKPVRREALGNLLDRWQHIILAQSHSPTKIVFSASELTVPEPPSLHLDLEYLHRLSDYTPEFELELLTIFLEDSLVHLKAIQQAAFNRDFQQLQRAAHHIKGSSANVGAKTIEFLAERLESQSYFKQDIETAELIAGLESSFTQVQIILNRMKDEAVMF